MVNDLNISPGNTILDLGCMPGLWTSLLSEKIRVNGRIVGFDIDEDFIGYASESLTEQNKEIIDFRIGDFYL